MNICGRAIGHNVVQSTVILVDCMIGVRYHVTDHMNVTRCSISDVAKAARVSRMTVSRVMQGRNNVAVETRNRVLAVMKQMGYVPSIAARALRSKDALHRNNAQCLALLFGPDTQLADGFFCDVARAAEAQAATHGLCLLQVHWQETFEQSWLRLQSLFSMDGVCGVILAGQFTTDQIDGIKQRVPHMVLVDSPPPDGRTIASVASDNERGCRLAFDRLRDRGCRSVLVLSGPPDHYFTQAMCRAAESQLTHRGVAGGDGTRPGGPVFTRSTPTELVAGDVSGGFDSIEIVHGQYTAQFAEQTIVELWQQGRRFDGIFGNDQMALGAIRGLADLGVSVPDDVKVIGFDNIPNGQYTVPRLTTIEIDKKRLGSEAVDTLVDSVRNGDRSCDVRKVITAKLVERESA